MHPFYSIKVPKLINAAPPSSKLKPQTFSFKGMHHPIYIVFCALNYYFCGNSTKCKVAQTLNMVHQVKVSYVLYPSGLNVLLLCSKKITADRLLGINLCDSGVAF